MGRLVPGLFALAITAAPAATLADDQGAMTGAAGGAVTGAIVGGPVGAAVGAAAGGAIGGAATGSNRTVVVPAEPCGTRTTTTTDDAGNSVSSRTTNCPD